MFDLSSWLVPASTVPLSCTRLRPPSGHVSLYQTGEVCKISSLHTAPKEHALALLLSIEILRRYWTTKNHMINIRVCSSRCLHVASSHFRVNIVRSRQVNDTNECLRERAGYAGTLTQSVELASYLQAVQLLAHRTTKYCKEQKSSN